MARSKSNIKAYSDMCKYVIVDQFILYIIKYRPICHPTVEGRIRYIRLKSDIPTTINYMQQNLPLNAPNRIYSNKCARILLKLVNIRLLNS